MVTDVGARRLRVVSVLMAAVSVALGALSAAIHGSAGAADGPDGLALVLAYVTAAFAAVGFLAAAVIWLVVRRRSTPGDAQAGEPAQRTLR